jgi:cellulose synthase/poly-beta-1,6-N-acetylglucosamine synthase-like glycosyltransferase
MDRIFTFMFICTLGFCFSTYFAYPAVIYLLSLIKPFQGRKKDFHPRVSVIISAYNEARHIERKIINTLEQDYPSEKIETIVGSDGSHDATVEIAGAFIPRGVKVIDFKMNQGKTVVQNECAKEATGEILIFTDAASFLNREAIRNIVRNFSDERVGCVAGCMRYINTDENLTTESQGLYWRYESKIRDLESRIGRLIGVDGPLYAIRRENYMPLKANVISDLISPLLVLSQKKKVVLEPDAVVDEEPTRESRQELSTRRRVTLRALIGLKEHSDLINPFKFPGLSLQITFHKLVRWFVGPLVLLNILSCVALSSNNLFLAILILYGMFFLAGAIGYFMDKHGRKIRIFLIPYYFTLVNVAATLAIVDFLRKKQAVSWQPVRLEP